MKKDKVGFLSLVAVSMVAFLSVFASSASADTWAEVSLLCTECDEMVQQINPSIESLTPAQAAEFSELKDNLNWCWSNWCTYGHDDCIPAGPTYEVAQNTSTRLNTLLNSLPEPTMMSLCAFQDPAGGGEDIIEVLALKQSSKSQDGRFVSVKINAAAPAPRNIVLYYETLVELNGFFFTFWYPSPTLFNMDTDDNFDDRNLVYYCPSVVWGGCFMFLFDPVTGQPTTAPLYFAPGVP